MSNIWDVVPPVDSWDEGYAHMEYLWVGLKMTFATKIEVVYESV